MSNTVYVIEIPTFSIGEYNDEGGTGPAHHIGYQAIEGHYETLKKARKALMKVIKEMISKIQPFTQEDEDMLSRYSRKCSPDTILPQIRKIDLDGPLIKPTPNDDLDEIFFDE